MGHVDYAAKLLNESSGITFNNKLSHSTKSWVDEADTLLFQICGEHPRYKEILRLKTELLQAKDAYSFESAKAKIQGILSIFAHAWDFMKYVNNDIS